MESLINYFGTLAQEAIGSRSALAFAIVFVAGFLVSLTPCVYPVIPITVGYIGGASGKSRMHGFYLSVSYVLGMAIVYTILGTVVNGVFKVLFGVWTNSVLLNLLVGNICLLFALSMLGLFDLKMPEFVTRRLPIGTSKGGLMGAFMVGALSALILGPCTTPALGAILTLSATSASWFYAAALMFVFSLGLGVLFIVIGTFAGILASLPKSGAWLVAVKVGFGIMLLLTAQYFIFTAGSNYVG
ncbi:MAG: cytochrome c biogenesis protein CcdA [Candidatus Brocadiia bacterium]